MRIFPNFSATIEAMLPTASTNSSNGETWEVRLTVNEAYSKINKAMWECLNFIAKDEPGVSRSGSHHHHHSSANIPSSTAVTGAGAGGTTTINDPEDKETLNYHILLIENMNHYLEEVDARSNSILVTWRDRADRDLSSHLAAYVDAVIRRPLGRWLEFIESSEVMLNKSSSASDKPTRTGVGTSASQDDVSSISASINNANSTANNIAPAPSPAAAAALASKSSHSRSTAKKLLSAHDQREIRKGIDTLKKRIEKHFGDGDDPVLAKGLVGKVFGECLARYLDAWDRMAWVMWCLYGGSTGGPGRNSTDVGEGGGVSAGENGRGDKSSDTTAGPYSGNVAGLEIEWRKDEVTALFRR